MIGEVDKIENIVVYRLDDYYLGDFLEVYILMEFVIFLEFNVLNVIYKNMK